MNHGCLITIPRPNGKVRNGTRKVLLVRRKQGENNDYCFFSIAVALCTRSLYLQDRQLIKPSTKMSWNDFENGPSESERTVQTIGCCTTITRQLHTALSIREFLAKRNIPVLPLRPYSPDLAPCDFYLFTKLRSKLKGYHFGTMENIQKVVTDELHALIENDFRYCYDQ